MSLNLISSLSFLKNKFESVGSSKGGGNGKSKKDAVFARNPTTRKVDLFSGITESDLDDSSSSSSEDDSDDDIVSSKMTSKANTPITTGYNTPVDNLGTKLDRFPWAPQRQWNFEKQ